MGGGDSIPIRVSPVEASSAGNLPPQKTNFFFYGHLMDADRFKGITGCIEVPTMHKAHITNFIKKRWSCYPTLVPAPSKAKKADSKIEGVCVEVEKEWIIRLQNFETAAYKTTKCIIVKDGGEKVEGLVFTWSGEDDDSELDEWDDCPLRDWVIVGEDDM